MFVFNTDKQLFGIFHIGLPINYLMDNFNKLTQMASEDLKGGETVTNYKVI